MGAAKPSPHAVMEVRRFQAGDFAAYRRWYADPLLDRHLGPMDDEWLADVLADTNGEEWAVLADGVLLAVVGLTPDPEVGCWVITDFAVDPRRRGQGWGAARVAGAVRAARPESTTALARLRGRRQPAGAGLFRGAGLAAAGGAGHRGWPLDLLLATRRGLGRVRYGSGIGRAKAGAGLAQVGCRRRYPPGGAWRPHHQPAA